MKLTYSADWVGLSSLLAGYGWALPFARVSFVPKAAGRRLEKRTLKPKFIHVEQRKII